MPRTSVVTVVLATAAFVAVAAAAAVAKFDLLVFEPRDATPGRVVTVRTRGTPLGFTNDERRRPFLTPLRLYLVPKRIASEVRSPLDRRLYFIGVLVPDRSGRGVLTFAAPPLETGQYAVAAWCRRCTYRPNFHVTPSVEGTLLHLTMPSAAQTCPVTRGTYGNGWLSARAPGPDGVLVAQEDPSGGLSQKLGWLPRKGFTGTLAVRGERLDASGQMRVVSVNWGYSSDGRGSWASAVVFPSEGCWRISGRVADVSLTYVVNVVRD
jgi:hypothetical protein